MAAPSLHGLPDELLQSILSLLPVESLLAIQLTSKRFSGLAEEPLLWRHFCRTQYKFWNSKHHIRTKFAAPVTDTDWKRLFIERRKTDRMTVQSLESILATQRGRIDKTESIVTAGYDAKDILLRHCNPLPEAEDVLARRYHSNAVLGGIHRAMAVEELKRLLKQEAVPLERALGVYDMFVLGQREGDFDNIAARLDQIARDVREQYPEFEELTPRKKALTLATYVRANELVGVREEAGYHALQNNFIGIALLGQEHTSLPLISVAIYCCIAERLGLRAQPCGFPWHVCAIVRPPTGQDLEGIDVLTNEEPEPMYMDPWRKDTEVPVSDLKATLDQMGATPSSYATFLGEASTWELVLRTGRNIHNSIQDAHRQQPHLIAGGNPTPGSERVPVWASTFPDIDGSFYAMLWSHLLLGLQAGEDDGAAARTTRRRTYLPYITEHIQTDYQMDVPLMETHVLPLFRDLPEHSRLLEILEIVRTGDAQAKPIMRRDAKAHNVRFRIGMLFQHKRYGYEAVITGWDPQCSMGDQWIEQMQIDRLPNGRDQSFYHVLVEDKSVRYVAEENIHILYTQPSSSLMRLAGKYFKRWDPETRRFVSNVKDEYPDD
ncbi:hypothetical protein B0A49_03353 [Cryomyces minteri]|uniref:F-box domain-containing protein n=2 Tax=Cryomyces TaxID=329878 RepID=A0A4U0X624_9PEZI|nr:hypothetical protein B0A49_03353 [Cryomyces minteri]